MKFRKILLSMFIAVIAAITLSSCGGISVIGQKEKISLIAPTGTPTLILGESIEEYGAVDTQIVNGPTALGAEFAKGQKDIIVAPVNLGAKLAASSEDFKYVLFSTIVWCNYYIVSTEEISNFAQLDGKDVTVFGLNSTPDIVFKSLVKHHNITPNVEYVASVNDANSALLTNKANIIVSAEPALSALLTKGSYHVYSLAEAWTEMAGFDGADVPQAAIFVKKDSIDKTEAFLNKVVENINNVLENKEEAVQAAKRVDAMLAPSEQVLVEAIERCNFKIVENEQESINIYFNKIIELGLGASIGGKLPDEEFYYQK